LRVRACVQVDAFKLYRYLSTVMPRGEPSPALVDMMPGSGQLALALAELFAGQHHVGVHVYGVEKEAQRVDRLTAAATARGVRNFSAVQVCVRACLSSADSFPSAKRAVELLMR
jgi:uncharacterized protein (UPF0264 family)